MKLNSFIDTKAATPYCRSQAIIGFASIARPQDTQYKVVAMSVTQIRQMRDDSMLMLSFIELTPPILNC